MFRYKKKIGHWSKIASSFLLRLCTYVIVIVQVSVEQILKIMFCLKKKEKGENTTNVLIQNTYRTLICKC